MLGWHWLAWGDGGTPEVLDDVERASTCLLALSRALELTVVQAPGAARADRGVVGVVLLAESHAALHTDRESGQLFVDVFSCKRVDVERAASVVAEHYPAVRLRHELTSRGQIDG